MDLAKKMNRRLRKREKKLIDALVYACDRLWRRIILLRAGGKCEITGSRRIVEAHHLVSRRHWCVRWYLRDGIAVTRKLHERPDLIDKWLEENRPKDYAWMMKWRQKINAGETKKKTDLKAVYRRLSKLCCC